MIDIRQSPQYAAFMEARGWLVRRVPALANPSYSSGSGSPSFVYAFIKRLPLLPFAVMKIQRFGVFPDFAAVDSLAQHERVLSITLEPGLVQSMTLADVERFCQERGYRRSAWPLLPTKTIWVDLKPSEKAILAQMKKDARSSIKNALRRCVSRVGNSSDLQFRRRFYEFWKRYGKGPLLSFSAFCSLLDSFGKHAFVVLTFVQEQTPLAGVVILLYDKCASYSSAAVSPLGRKAFAGYLAVWNAIREAKRRRCLVFDLEGVYDERFPQLKRWKGFSLFKHKFGGIERTYPGCFTRFSLSKIVGL